MPKRRGRGEGGIEQLASGSWRGVVCRTTPDGKRVRQSKTFPLKADLLAWMNKAKESGPSPAGTVDEWFDQWLALHKGRVAAKTYKGDEWTVAKYLRGLGAEKLRDLKPTKIETHIRSLPVSESERHKAAKILRTCLNAAVHAGVIPASPMIRVRMPKKPVSAAWSLTEVEFATLIRHADQTPWGYLFRLWGDSGVRPAELLALKWGDFDPSAGTIRVERSVCGVTGQLKDTKTPKSRRLIYLASSTVAALRVCGLSAPETPIVPTPTGKHWWPDNFSEHVFRPIVQAAGVKCVPYTMRHTMATLLLRAGVNLKVVSERLGHEDVTMTLKTYQHVMPDDQEKAAVAMGSLLPTFSPRPPEDLT